MTRTTITGLFGLATAGFMLSVVIGLAGTVAAVGNGAVELGGPQLVAIHGGPIARAIVAYAVAGAIAAAGALAMFAAWGGALVNTWRFEDRTWFAGLLVAGVAGLAWIGTGAYLVASPDREPVARPPRSLPA